MPYIHPNVLEAEDFTLVRRFQVVDGASERGDYVNIPTIGSALMQTTVNGIPGVYDLTIYYYDEANGRGSSAVRVDGRTVTSWTWSQELGSSLASAQTYTSRTIRNVEIRDGALIEIEGQRVDRESLRIDKVVLAPPADRLDGTAEKAFPGAEGFGSDTAGGRGGVIVKVTNLNDSGPGSLRYALEEVDLPRIVVFEVGGVITLRSQIDVKGDVTVAGQTAPGEGVTIRGARLRVVEDDVIIRGLKFRPGEGPGLTLNNRDGISVGSPNTIVENVVIDGNSFSWAPDENIDVWYGARNVTISNNIIAEGLKLRTVDLESFGVLVGDNSSNISIIKNMFISSEFRNPTIAEATNVEIVNNYIYNYGQHAISFTANGAEFTRGHVIGNYIERGPESGNQRGVRLVNDSDCGVFYLSDNLSVHRTSSSMPESAVAGGALSTMRSNPVFSASDVRTMSARDVKDYVLENAGARARGLDDTDARLISEALDGRGSIKFSTPSGAYSIPTAYSNRDDSDGDGIPNEFEASIGGNATRFDPHVDADRDGYSNIEEYINGLISRASGSSGGAALPVPPTSFRIEAEAFNIVSGFRIGDRPIASDEGALELRSGSTGVARHVFEGADGVYDLDVGYFDENDGVGRMEIWVNDREIADWRWNQDLGSTTIAAQTRTERAIADVALRTGDVVELRAFRDAAGLERMVTDYIDFL